METFSEKLGQHGIRLADVASPLDRAMMNAFRLRRPIGFGNFFHRALWFSFIFVVTFFSLFCIPPLLLLGFEVFNNISAGTWISIIWLCLCVGFLPAYFEQRSLRQKYGRQLLQTLKQ